MSKRPSDQRGMMDFFRSKNIRINVENEDEAIEEDPLPLDQGTELAIDDDESSEDYETEHTAGSQPVLPETSSEFGLSDESSNRTTLDIGEVSDPFMISDEDRIKVLRGLQLLKLTPDQYPSSSHNVKGKMEIRKLSKAHLIQFPWLAVSTKVESKGAFCKACVLFIKEKQVGGNEVGVLVSKPLTQFKRLTGKSGILTRHQQNRFHLGCVEALDNFESILKDSSKDIRNLVSKQHQEETERQSNLLLPIVDTVTTLCQQNIALRGHRHEEGIINSDGIDPLFNDGNFRAICRLLIRRGDNNLKHHCETAARNCTMMSGKIQNSIIDITKSMLREGLVERVNSALCWTMLADETTDNARKELIAFCVRYVGTDSEGKSVLREEVVAIRDVIKHIRNRLNLKEFDEVKLSGENIGNTLLAVLAELGLNTASCIGQGYDGCSVMSSERVGTAFYVQKVCSLADYYHCVLHKLNLSASAVIKDKNMKLAQKTIAKISSFFRGSAKRVEFLKTVIAAENDSRITTKLVRMCETRFIERHTSVEVLRNLLVYVIKALHGMQSWNNSDTAGDAYTLENTICSQRFISSLVMLEHITCKLKPATVKLQSKQVDVVESMVVVNEIKDQLVAMKGDVYWGRVFDEVEELADLLNVQLAIPRAASRHTLPEHAAASKSEQVSIYLKGVWSACVTNVIDDLSAKFGKSKDHLQYLQALVPAYIDENVITCEKISQELFKKYDELLPETSLITIEGDVDRWQKHWRKVDKNLRPGTAISAIDKAKSYGSVKTLLIILATLPVSSCEPERVFSKVELTETAVRCSMSSDRLEGIVMIQALREYFPSCQEIVDRFLLTKNRRI